MARVVILIVLFVLPVQMRAGAHDAHPHALLQLLLDARDGAVDHHEPSAANHDADADHARPADLPEIGESGPAGGVAMLAALVVAFIVPGHPAARTWPAWRQWRGTCLALEPPPPRGGLV